MRGSKAKVLRKLAVGIVPDKPRVSYNKKKHIKRIGIPTAAGIMPMQAICEVWTLADCQRKKYKDLKKLYKQGVFA